MVACCLHPNDPSDKRKAQATVACPLYMFRNPLSSSNQISRDIVTCQVLPAIEKVSGSSSLWRTSSVAEMSKSRALAACLQLEGAVCHGKASSESTAHLVCLAVDGCSSHSVHNMHGQCNGVGVQIFSKEPLRGPSGHKHGTGVQVLDLQTFVAQDLQTANNNLGACMGVAWYAWSMLWLMRV